MLHSLNGYKSHEERLSILIMRGDDDSWEAFPKFHPNYVILFYGE